MAVGTNVGDTGSWTGKRGVP